MAGPPSDPGMRPNSGSTAGTPTWVKVFGIIVAVVVLLLVILLVAGRGHGPGRHTGSSDVGGQTAPASVIANHAATDGDAGGQAPPEGGPG